MQTSTSIPECLQTLTREAAIKRLLILEGNVNDIFYDPEQRQYVNLSECLRRVIRQTQNLSFTLMGL